jgi:HK97 family phage prohead protease
MEKLKGILERKEGEIYGVASTETIDRQGEVIKQDGWELDNFKSNPVLLVSHNYQEFPIGKATEIKVEGGRLVFRAVFSQTTQKAIEAYSLIKEGILNAFSVGFIPREYDDENGNIITKAELLEISLVPVPANPEAVVLAKEFKDNEIANYIVKNFLEEEKENNATEVASEEVDKKNGEDSVEVGDTKLKEDLDLKLLQRTTGYLQELCRELKKKGGKTK